MLQLWQLATMYLPLGLLLRSQGKYLSFLQSLH